MTKANQTSVTRREALFSMLAGAMLAPHIAHAATETKEENKSDDGLFHPTLPYKTPVGTQQPMGIESYGPCNGKLDIIMSDLMPSRNKFGQFINENGDVVNEASEAKMVPQKNLLLFVRDLPGAADYGNQTTTLPDGTIVGADYGGHYHEGTEVLYCPSGKYRVEVRENSGKDIVDFEGDTVTEYLPNKEHGPRFVEIFEANQPPQKFPLTDKIQSFDVTRGQMMIIPGRAYHSVYMIESGDMLVYLPDAKRFAEEAHSYGPSTCKL